MLAMVTLSIVDSVLVAFKQKVRSSALLDVLNRCSVVMCGAHTSPSICTSATIRTADATHARANEQRLAQDFHSLEAELWLPVEDAPDLDVNQLVGPIVACWRSTLRLNPSRAQKFANDLYALPRRDVESVSEARVHDTLQWLRCQGFQDNQVAAMLGKHAALGTQDPRRLQATYSQLFGLWLSDRRGVNRAIRRNPHLLCLTADDVGNRVDYLLALGLEATEVRKLVRRHTGVLCKNISANIAFLASKRLTASQICDMIRKAPGWIVQPLNILVAKWAYIMRDLKGSVDDICLYPQLLELDILQVVGPRLGYARMKHYRVLMPSYTRGHPILQQSDEWSKHKVVPLQFYVGAGRDWLCQVLQFDGDDFQQYQDSWIATTGQAWLQYSHRVKGSKGAGGML